MTDTIDIQGSVAAKPLVDYFNRIMPLDGKESHFTSNAFTERQVNRRQFILKEDEIFSHNTFVTEAPSGIGTEGVLKSYEFVFYQLQLNIELFIEEIVVEDEMA
ncbi:MAG: hypothetical protein KC517_06525 [Bacteroidetes bacterium]|jgi:hypothetical protein|nr:hypothetical protein [Bacteroidota bacterium]